jgi:hypothetical protein
MTSVLGMTINGPAFNVFMNAAGRPTMWFIASKMVLKSSTKIQYTPKRSRRNHIIKGFTEETV